MKTLEEITRAVVFSSGRQGNKTVGLKDMLRMKRRLDIMNRKCGRCEKIVRPSRAKSVESYFIKLEYPKLPTQYQMLRLCKPCVKAMNLQLEEENHKL